jgi:uncharacterized protein YndB with AHSA1/START domain
MPDHPEQLTECIERDAVVLAPPDRVWEVVTGPDWLAEDVQMDLVPGSDAQFGFHDDTRKTGWVEEATAPAEGPGGAGRLVFWWSGDDELATRVELTLEPEGENATRLRVVESRPLDVLDVIGIPLPGSGGASHGPAMLAAV